MFDSDELPPMEEFEEYEEYAEEPLPPPPPLLEEAAEPRGGDFFDSLPAPETPEPTAAPEPGLELGLPQKRRARVPVESIRKIGEGGPGTKILFVAFAVGVLITFVLSIIFSDLRNSADFWFYLVAFTLVAQFDLSIKGGGELNLGVAVLIAALLSTNFLTLTAGCVLWIFFFGTLVEAVVRLIFRSFSKDLLMGMMVDYVGAGIMVGAFALLVRWMKPGTLYPGGYWVGLLVSVGIAAVLYFLVQLVRETFVLSQEGAFPPSAYFKSVVRRTWLPYLALVFTGFLMGLIYRGVNRWAILFAVPLLFVIRYAYNRVAATDEYLIETIRTLAAIPEETGMVRKGHGERVATVSVAVAQELGLSPEDVKQVEYAAYLHDIGAITRQRELGTEQRQLLEVEGVIAGGVDIVGTVDYLDVAAEILRGREGLRDRVADVEKRRAVSMGAGILRAVDDFESLVQGREDREPVSESDALIEMNLERGVRYDSKVLRAIARVISILPREVSLVAEGSTEGSPIRGEQES